MHGAVYAEEYRDTGYFIVDDAVEADSLDLLEAALRRVVDKIHCGSIVDDNDRIGVNGVGQETTAVWGLIAPEFDEPVFAQYLAKRIYLLRSASLSVGLLSYGDAILVK